MPLTIPRSLRVDSRYKVDVELENAAAKLGELEKNPSHDTLVALETVMISLRICFSSPVRVPNDRVKKIMEFSERALVAMEKIDTSGKSEVQIQLARRLKQDRDNFIERRDVAEIYALLPPADSEGFREAHDKFLRETCLADTHGTGKWQTRG